MSESISKISETPTSISKTPTETSNNTDISPNLVHCPKCDATRIAKSRPQNFDYMIMNLLPRRPYRCLHCYHRFWLAESFFARPKRKRTWVWVVLLTVIMIFLFSLGITDKNISTSSEYSTLWGGAEQPQAPKASSTAQKANNIEVTPETSITLATSQNLNEQDKLIASGDPPKVAGISKENQRDMIKNLDFSPPEEQDLSKPALSKDQLEKQLDEAKVRSETAERINKQKQASFAERLNVEQEEQRSLTKIEINFAIDQWKNAWQSGQTDRYLEMYSNEFTPANGQSLSNWKQQRSLRVTPNKKIQLELSKFDVSFISNTKVRVNFDQFYVSSNYSDVTRKELVFIKQQDQWKIQSEKEVK